MRETAPVRVVLVDDHPMVRLSLKVALSTAPDVMVVGEAADGEEALRVCGALHPEVVLMDLLLPRQDGVETIEVDAESLLAEIGSGVDYYVLSVTGEQQGGAQAIVVGIFRGADAAVAG